MKIYKQKPQDPKYQLGQVVFYMEEGDTDIVFKPFVVRMIYLNFSGSVSYSLMPVVFKANGEPKIDPRRNQRERIHEKYLVSDPEDVVSYTGKVAKRLRDKIFVRTQEVRAQAELLSRATNLEIREMEEE